MKKEIAPTKPRTQQGALATVEHVLPAVAFLAGFSGPALTTMAQSLRVIVGLFRAEGDGDPDDHPVDPNTIPWGRIERAHVKRIRELLSARYAPATARRHFTALRGVLAEAQNTAALGVRGPTGTSEEKGRALSAAEVNTLLDSCAPTFRGAQLRALVAVGVFAGLRRAEIAGLDLSDFDRETGDLTVRRGKGRKARAIRLAPRAQKILADWISSRGTEPGPLLFGAGQTARIGISTVAYRLEALGHACAVKHFSSHDLRRTFVTRILEMTGGDLRTAQKLAGHASIDTTTRYDRRDRAVMDAASTTLDY